MTFLVQLLVPPLSHVFRSHHIPTVLRTSALSLLSECVNTSSHAFLPYAEDLSDAMIDLLQVESVRAVLKPSSASADDKGSSDDQVKPTMDTQPTSTDSKLPPLRRAALYFLQLLLRASMEHIYDPIYQGHSFSAVRINRARTTLEYVASTDEDNVVRIMAREAIEGIARLHEAIIGL